MADEEVKIKITTEEEGGVGGISKVKGMLEDLVGKVPGFSAQLGLIGAGLAAGLGVAAMAATKFVGQMSEVTQQTSNMAQRLGYSVEALGEWEAVAKGAGVSIDQLASAQQSLSRNFTTATAGGKQQSAVFKAMDIDITKTTSSSELMLQVADRFKTMADGPEKTALAMKLMGGAGAQLIPVLNGGRDAIQANIQAAHEYGAVMSTEMVEKGLRVNNALNETSMGMTGIKNAIFEALAPAVATLVESFNTWIKGLIESYQTGGIVKQMVDGLAVGMKALVAVAITLGSAWSILYNTIGAAVIITFSSILALSKAIAQVWNGDLTGAAKTFGDAMVANGKRAEEALKNVKGTGQNFKKSMSDLLGDTAKNPKATGQGTDTPPVTGGPQRSQMSIWQEEWTQREIASKNFYDNNKAEELAFWQSKLAAVKSGTQESAAIQRKVFELQKSMANQALQEELANIDAKKEAARDDFAESMKLQEEKMALIASTYGADSQQYANALREKERMTRQHNQLLISIARDRINTLNQIELGNVDAAYQVENMRIQAKEDAISQERALGQLSASQEIAQKNALLAEEFAMESQHEERIYQIKVKALQDQLALDSTKEADRARMLNDIEALEAAHANRVVIITEQQTQKMQRANDQAAKVTANKWQSIFAPIGQGFSGLFQNMYNGTMTFKQGMLKMLDQILFAFVDMVIQMGVKWAAGQMAQTAQTVIGAGAKTAAVATGQAAQTAAVTAGVATRTAAEASGAAAGMATSGATTLAQIGNAAMGAAAGAYSAIAGIPYVGPFLAPVMAAAALAAVIGFGASVVSASGGMGEVDKDQMAMIHKKEMILPAHIAQPLRESLAGGWSPTGGGARATGGQSGSGATAQGGPSRGGDNNFYYSPQSNVQDQNFEKMLQRNGSTFKKWVKNQQRNGAK